MNIKKYTDYILIEGLEEHSQGYDKQSFQIKRLDSSSVLFLIEIVSPYSVKLHFLEDIKETERLIVTININGNSQSLLAEEIIEAIPIVPAKEKKLKYIFKDDSIVIKTKDTIMKDELEIYIEKFCLERYDDFPDEEIYVDIPCDDKGRINNIIPFNFELDYIYKVHIEYNNEIIDREYIHKKPTFYISSIYHIKQLANNYDLYITENEKTEFDIKLLLWKYSKIAYGIAGTVTDDVVYVQNNALLNDYVCHRVLLDIVSTALTDINLTPDLVEKSLGTISVTLADLSHGEATTETMTTQLIKTHQELLKYVEHLEEQIEDVFDYLYCDKKIADQSINGKPVKRIGNYYPKQKRWF
jgi:hypothetical protein